MNTGRDQRWVLLGHVSLRLYRQIQDYVEGCKSRRLRELNSRRTRNRSYPSGCEAFTGCCVDWQGPGSKWLSPALRSSTSMSSRAFLNSFMLCPRLRARSGNFFAPNRMSTIRRMINKSGPPKFPIPKAKIFISKSVIIGVERYQLPLPAAWQNRKSFAVGR